MNKQNIILFFTIHSVICLEKFLQFYPNPEITDRKSVYELNQRPVEVDAYQTSQILIKYIQYIGDINFPNIKFYCNVKPLDIDYKINNAALCKKEFLKSKADCHSITKDVQTVKFGDIMEFDVKYDTQNGIIATLSMDIKLIKTRKNPFDGFYYCKLSNLLGSISSNYIEIQDYEFYKQNLSKLTFPIIKQFVPTPIDDFTMNSFPLYIDCGKTIANPEKNLPKWVNKDMISPFRWNLCPNANTGIDCFTTILDTELRRSRSLEDFIDYYQYLNGTIALMGIKSSEFVKSGLVCTSKSMPPQKFVIYMVKEKNGWRSINYLKNTTFNKKIQPLSSRNVDVVIREGAYASSRFKLFASYVANPDHTKVAAEWKKDGYGLPNTFIAGPYDLTMPLEITEYNTGNYVLKVSQSEPYDSVLFKYSVNVVGVPRLKDRNLYSPILYRTEDQTVNISISFDRSITKMSIEINGLLIDFSTPEMKANSLKDLFYKFPFLTGINVSSKFEITKDIGKAMYEVTDLFRNRNAHQTKTHTVTFVGENEIGISKVSVLVRVFENPVFKNYLNIFNCTSNCMNTEKHIFKCSIDESEYLAEGCTIEYLWTLNGHSLNSMNEKYDQKAYFQIVNDTLIIDPIKSEDKERDERMIKILTNAVLSCQVIIYEPNKLGRTLSEKLYVTDSNPSLKALLEAKINLQVNPIDSASASWILPFIISLIVILVITVLILYFCLRGSGETYNVDQKERAQGHDPEKEIRDNEIFQPYERDHETNVLPPSHLSFNDDDSVGVGSDDGELDVYDIDPGKFNEEGSFIGEYASDPRRNKVNSK